MTSRERISLALAHKEADRVAIHDSPWATTVQRWHREGLPQDVSPEEYFNYEIAFFSTDTSLQLPTETVEDTDEYVINRNANGALVRNWKHRTSTPEMIDFTITTPEIWKEHRPRLAWNDSRIDLKGLRERHKKATEQGKFRVYGAPMGYDKTQGIVGSERLLISTVESPEWASDMFSATVDILMEGAQAVMDAGLELDGGFLFDDMGYRNASLFSPQTYRDVLKPHHTRACDFFHTHNMPIILHSCGCVAELVPDLIEAGFDCLQPLEVKAGMDVIELKRTYGDRLAFMGGIDVRAMADANPARIEEEIKTKIPFARQHGGYIFHSDHSVPDNVSWKQYQRVIELVLHYGEFS
jgi:uroporphyrinogen decarboxylase